MHTKELLEKYFSNFDIKLLNLSVLEKFYIYLNEIKKYNNKIDLTSIKTDKEIIVKHFIDSIYLLKSNNVSQYETLLDVGSGAGFPGIPIAIILPRIKITLLESNKKRVLFLKHIVNILNLKNVDILFNRAEIAAKNCKYRENYDSCTIRAFSNFNTSIEITNIFIKNNGLICFYASQKQVHEINKNLRLHRGVGINICNIFSYKLPDNYGQHSIIFVKKLWKTASIYHGMLNKIKKNPL